jgi:steroid delta-isomerase-like uncharacterized protein
MPETPTKAETVTSEWAEEFVERYIAAWNSHRPERLLELMTEDIVYDDSGWPKTMRGHAEVREFSERFFRAFPNLSFEPERPLIATDRPGTAFCWRFWGTNTGRIYGLPATGKRLVADGADFHEYRDGKIARLRVVYDMADAFRQLGLLPSELGGSATG